MLVEFLTHNPQYTPPPEKPVHPDVDFYILSQVVKGKGPNRCFFGGGHLAGTLRSRDRNLYQRTADGEGGSRQINLTPDQLELVRQLARRESEDREAALKAQMDARMKAMRGEHNRQIEAMAKRQADMEEQMRQFMQAFGRNPNSGGQKNNHQNNNDFLPDISDDSNDSA